MPPISSRLRIDPRQRRMQDCSFCSLHRQPYQPMGLRCPQCHGIVQDRLRRHLVHGHSPCTLRQCFIHGPNADIYVCYCPCECSTAEEVESDYEESSESETLDRGKDIVEARHVRNYGVRNNDSCYLDNRGVPHESGLHYTAATRDNPEHPAESSLPNAENAITNVEVLNLQRPLDPWEAEAMMRTSNVSVRQLHTAFPETRAYLQVPDPPVMRFPEPEPLICPRCRRPFSREVRISIHLGLTTICDNCTALTPRTPGGLDPDLVDFNQHLATDGLRFCSCRCRCGIPGRQLRIPASVLFPEERQARIREMIARRGHPGNIAAQGQPADPPQQGDDDFQLPDPASPEDLVSDLDLPQPPALPPPAPPPPPAPLASDRRTALRFVENAFRMFWSEGESQEMNAMLDTAIDLDPEMEDLIYVVWPNENDAGDLPENDRVNPEGSRWVRRS